MLPIAVDSPAMEPSATDERRNGGAIGVGTWLTQAEFKDIKVTKGDKTLFSCDFADGTKGWRLLGGDWQVAGRRAAPEQLGRERPGRRGRPVLDRLHLHPQGPQARRRRGLPDPLPRARRRPQELVEPRRLGQPAARHRDGRPRRQRACPAPSRPAAGTTSASR